MARAMRVLFVDDDPTGLAALRNSLSAHNPGWSVHVASTPNMAVVLAERQDFDVVLISTDAPRIVNIDPFTYFHDHFPETVRIAWLREDGTRHAHAESLAYQSIYRSAPVEFIGQIIERAAELHRRLADPQLNHLIKNVEGLPSPPRIVMQLNEALVRPNVTVNQVTDIVSQDVAIPAQILHVVNTAYFALSRTMTSIREAVAYLGFDAVRNMTLAVEMFRELTDPTNPSAVKQVEILQTHSSAVAQMTRQFITHQQDAQDAFVGGLLHDVGHLMMATYFPLQYAEICQRVAEGAPVLETERAILGATHADLGAYLLRSWGLPYRLVDIVAFHHEAPRFSALGMDAVHGVYIGEHLLAERRDVDETYWEFNGLEDMDDEYLADLGIYERVMSWRMLHVGFRSMI